MKYLLALYSFLIVSSLSQAKTNQLVTLGPRPFFLLDQMSEGPLKEKLKSCELEKIRPSDFVIGHRGAPLQFPEHTKESYLAAARMGAGTIECDVTFTKDLELVCRHSQCDLHTTTDILKRPELAAKCQRPFSPYDPKTNTPAHASCCTTDITLAEFKTLCGKVDSFDPKALSPKEYLGGIKKQHTGLYAGCGTMMSHQQSISLFKELDVKMIPEIKRPIVSMPYKGKFSQEAFIKKTIHEYQNLNIPMSDVSLQSFNLKDILYIKKNFPTLTSNLVYLDARFAQEGFDANDPTSWKPDMIELKKTGVDMLAPPLWILLTLDENKNIVASPYALKAKKAGLKLATWTLERSGLLSEGGGFYFQSVKQKIKNEGDVYIVLDVLAQQVGIEGIFTDWPATASLYAHCMGL